MRLAFVLATLWLAACGSAQDPSAGSDLSAASGERFPTIPQESITPGTRCKNPDEYRYPEKIAYCNRSVSTAAKNKIISTYDSTFQYTIGSMPRADFKIDHYIPLCMGGSNEAANLWPQHKSVYAYTDMLEQKLCVHLEKGRIKQAEAISLLKYAKTHLSEAARIEQDVDSTYGK